VVTENGVRVADVHVLDSVILRIAEPREGEARDEIDARGLVVLPGVVDAHAHVNEPGRTEWEGWLAATRGAAAGGITTLADMPLNSIPPTLDADAFDAKYEAASRSAIVDFALWGGLVDANEARLRELAACGVVGVKAFLCPSGVEEFGHLREDDLKPALAAAAAAGLLVAAHCEDEATIALASEQLRGRKDPRSWLESRPQAAERIAVEQLGTAARAARASVHVVHASSETAITAARRARQSGAAITIETCPHYLAFDADDVDRVGSALKCAPPIRDAATRERLWQQVMAGGVDLIASDHSPCTAEMKKRGDEDIWAAWGGVSGLQAMLPVMLTEGVHRRGVSLMHLAQLLATKPAKLLGLYPRKGAIRTGSDADLVLIDLDREWTLDPDHLEARSGISPYLGMRLKGAIVRTIVRGHPVFADDEVTGKPGDGHFVQRVA